MIPLVIAIVAILFIAAVLARLPHVDLSSDRGALGFSTADAVLKEDYKGPVTETLNNGNIMLAIVERNTEDFSGRRFVAPLHIGRNTGVGARAENGTLPSAGNQAYIDTFGPVRAMYARLQLSGMIIEAMGKDRTSFIRALRPEMEGATNDAKRDYCRQVWGTSDGVLATCGTTTTSTTVQLATATTDNQLRAIEEGFLVDIGTVGSPTSIATGRTPSAVDYTNKTFVISGATVSTTSSHRVYRSGAGGASSNTGNPGDGQIELTGLQTMVSDTATCHTVNPSTYPKFKARVDANGGTARAISENIVNKNLMRLEIESGGVPDLLVGSDGTFRSYANVLTAAKRFVGTIDLKGGYTAVGVGLVPSGRQGGKQLGLTWDRDCPNGNLYELTTGDFSFYELAPWQWMDATGATLIQVGDTDAYSATLKRYGELVCRRRNSQGVIKDITEA